MRGAFWACVVLGCVALVAGNEDTHTVGGSGCHKFRCTIPTTLAPFLHSMRLRSR